MQSKDRSGHVAKIIQEKGFGFIADADPRAKDLFFHCSEVRQPLVFDNLQEGQKVIFDARHGDRGPAAVNVRAE